MYDEGLPATVTWPQQHGGSCKAAVGVRMYDGDPPRKRCGRPAATSAGQAGSQCDVTCSWQNDFCMCRAGQTAMGSFLGHGRPCTALSGQQPVLRGKCRRVHYVSNLELQPARHDAQHRQGCSSKEHSCSLCSYHQRAKMPSTDRASPEDSAHAAPEATSMHRRSWRA